MKKRETDSNENVVTLYVTRHGKTILNANHRAQGWADSPLVEKGVEVASNLGTGLKDVHFTSVYKQYADEALQNKCHCRGGAAIASSGLLGTVVLCARTRRASPSSGSGTTRRLRPASGRSTRATCSILRALLGTASKTTNE